MTYSDNTDIVLRWIAFMPSYFNLLYDDPLSRLTHTQRYFERGVQDKRTHIETYPIYSWNNFIWLILGRKRFRAITEMCAFTRSQIAPNSSPDVDKQKSFILFYSFSMCNNLGTQWLKSQLIMMLKVWNFIVAITYQAQSACKVVEAPL